VIAAIHAGAIDLLPGARLVAVTDVAAGAAAAFAAGHGCAAEPGLDALLARGDVEVVCVCVPSGLHADVGTRAAKAGKHLVVEKPIDISLDAADRLIEAAQAAGVALTVMSQHRFDAGVVELKRLLGEGALGRLVLGEASTKWYRSQAYYDSAAWRGTYAMDGGSLMNQGIHYVDLLRWCMGPAAEVTAVCSTLAHQIEAEDTALAIVGFSSGAVGTILSSTAAFPGFPQRLEITGTEGTVTVEDGQVVRRALRAGDDPATSAGPRGELGTAIVRVFSFFIPAGEPPERHRDQVIDRMGALTGVAEERGLVLAHENEKEIYGDTPGRCADLITAVDSPALRATFDPANFVQCGVRPFSDAYGALRPYLVYLQVKDALAATGEVVPAGQGDGQLRETLCALRDSGFTGFMSLEPHLVQAGRYGGFSGPDGFRRASRALKFLLNEASISWR
jgi:UDP-N-acetyl-2-amino-2-deoxyglucuronate dehydrogenase